MQKNAIISVFNKDEIAEFVNELVELGFKIYSSGGTAEHLKNAGIRVTDISTIVGMPILGHRVVTLSREIHAGILARDCPEDREELERLKVPWFDLVCVDFYPLKKTTSDPDATHQSVIELTDIGGPTMVRSAAKGRRIVICRTCDRKIVVNWLKNDCPDKEEFLNYLAARAEFEVANYCLESARFHSHGGFDGFLGVKTDNCEYGENRWQSPAALYTCPSESIHRFSLEKFKCVHGGNLSYNNFCDVDRLLQTITHIAAGFDTNYGRVPNIAVAVKHGNACGAAFGDNPIEVVQKTVIGDTLAIFGGLVMINFLLTEEIMETLLTLEMPAGKKRILDAIIVPNYQVSALAMLEETKIKLILNKSLAKLDSENIDKNKRFRYVRGGFLSQPNYTNVLNLKDPNLFKSRELAEEDEKNLLLAWAIGSTSNSNTITLVKDRALIGNAVGQQDRVGSAKLAIERARRADHQTNGAVAYSDSFFPFPDGPEVLTKAGVKAVLTSSGSVKDNEVKEVFVKNNIALYMIPDKLGRGFYGH